MGTIDEIKGMQAAGKTDVQIQTELKQRGLSDVEISESLGQAKIKAAVGAPGAPAAPVAGGAPVAGAGGGVLNAEGSTYPGGVPPPGVQEQPAEVRSPGAGIGGLSEAPQATEQYIPGGGYEGMQPSLMSSPEAAPEQESYPPEGYGGGYEGYGAGGYPEYQPYAEAMSSDVITEISEQVVSEKLMQMRESLEEAIGFKSIAEAKIASLGERLLRIEKIIDRLQLNVLHKVGEYVGDVKDVKTELTEMQKSFRAILPELRSRGKKKKKKP